MANKDFKVKNGIDIQSPLPVSMGGTGQTTTGNTLNALLPSQAGNSSKVLSTDGTNTSWIAQSVAYQRGGTASRPVGPTAGDLYYNTDYNYFESYTSNGWFPIAAAPGTPTGVSATNQPTGRAYNNGSMSVQFTASTSGGAPTSFIVTPSPSTSPSTFTGSSSPITVTGLASSTQYTYTVQATSPYGTSSASSPSSGITATTVPAAPASLSATAGDQQASIAFTPVTGGSTITNYKYSTDNSTFTAFSPAQTSSPVTITGLTNGTAYTFYLKAVNANGDSAASSGVSVTPVAPITGSYDALAVYTVPSGGASSITFAGIPQSGYQHLQLRMFAKSVNTLANDTNAINLKINNDTGNNYSLHYMYGNGSSVTAASAGSNGSAFGGWVNSNNYSASNFTANILDILDYTNTSKYKTVRVLTGNDGNGAGYVFFTSGSWQSTSAINSLNLSLNYDFAQYSQFALYGIRG